MLPLVGIPPTIEVGLAPYRGRFCRTDGFEHVSCYVMGLILSSNKTVMPILLGALMDENPAGAEPRKQSQESRVRTAHPTAR